MVQSAATAPIRLSVSVPATPDRAFVAFTTEMGRWWPVSTHSIDEGTATEVVFEERVGGRVYERSAHGKEEFWAEVLVWDPPHRLVLAWRPNPEPGPRTEVEVTFHRQENGTRVDLEHRAWERLGALAAEHRGGYASDEGWVAVLHNYVGWFDNAPSSSRTNAPR
jgi:uncharacterized protein YndB with AHSA1/START domain